MQSSKCLQAKDKQIQSAVWNGKCTSKVYCWWQIAWWVCQNSMTLHDRSMNETNSMHETKNDKFAIFDGHFVRSLQKLTVDDKKRFSMNWWAEGKHDYTQSNTLKALNSKLLMKKCTKEAPSWENFRAQNVHHKMIINECTAASGQKPTGFLLWNNHEMQQQKFWWDDHSSNNSQSKECIWDHNWWKC